VNLKRRLKYYFLKFIRIKGEPGELALGLACGFFAGMLPVIPFHTVLAVALAIVLKSSKITAAIGVWISNPLNWYFLYLANYKIGAWILGHPAGHHPIAAIIKAIHQNEAGMVVFHKLINAGGLIVANFMLGGVLMGVVAAVPSYFIFLRFFKWVRIWRAERKEKRFWLRNNQTQKPESEIKKTD
jgi:hypothetical protein